MYRCDPVIEDVLVDVGLHKMMEEYRVHLENLSFTYFSHLMEITRRTNESMKKSMSTIMPTWPLAIATERNGGS